VTVHVHPTSSELLAALQEPDRVTSTLRHVQDCPTCHGRLSRLRASADFTPPTDGAIQRLVKATTPMLAVVADLVAPTPDREPQTNEIWRVGRNEAVLVWVRQVFDDGVADVVPLVLDVALADQHSIIVRADATPLATETVAMVALRSHVHFEVFINRVGELDIRREVDEVMAAVQEGRRPSGVPVGPPIDDDRDQRLEYRQAIRDLLDELAPSAWSAASDIVAADRYEPFGGANTDQNDADIDSLRASLNERMSGIQFALGPGNSVPVDHAVNATHVATIAYLGATTVLVTLNIETEDAYPDVGRLVAACRILQASEPDANAVAVAVPRGDWPTQFFPSSHLRPAYQSPGGGWTGPAPAEVGLGLVDTLAKYLQGTGSPWEVIDSSDRRLERNDLHQVAARHAAGSLEQIRLEGRRARQPAKQTAWQSLEEDLDERLAQFVITVVNNNSVANAVDNLLRDSGDD
jgi:hypothetical protein